MGFHAQVASTEYRGAIGVAADTDPHSSRFFGLSGDYWLSAQAAHGAKLAKDVLANVLAKIRPIEHADA